ncbi:hypothetical protein FGG08_000426 [Glutinoglossum americanum]|uniref:Kinesin motor domain-containing protein n=1 Tax=Glutinoglossum americanum TaxID=1670608 RepID=A0A9P8L627_9PEZI|nr:hypothetical protein FGG08_000426 [Glutinoglossum americanum]
MASSPPGSPPGGPQRPMSAMFRPPRSSSRMSTSSKIGGGSRASDEDGKTSVKEKNKKGSDSPDQVADMTARSPFLAVRVRPPLKPTDPGFDLIPQRFQRSMVQVTSPTSLAVDSPQGRKLFVFDRVFGEEVGQEGVWGYLNESVTAFTQGYNVSLLAYGQSGAGKSYTMGTSGPAEQNDAKVMGKWSVDAGSRLRADDPTIPGVIPRAAAALFEKLGSHHRHTGSGLRTPIRYSTSSAQVLSKPSEKNWSMKATYVEIYNEQLRDLLLPESVPQGERGNVTIREDAKGRILLTGLHQVTINSIDDLLGALNFGSSIRQTDATAINAKSSRSHAVFSLNLIQRKRGTSSGMTAQEKRFSVPTELLTGAEGFITVDSKFHFVDLAGSERLKNTGAQGERAKEGISINAGLASLGKVISQLSSRQAGSHVSYRDSKLTRLLQDSLGGNAITYMIACVTPAEFHLSETLNTVQYAQRARAIQSKPRIQQVSDDGDKQALIERLRAEVAFLREQIRNSDRGDRRSNVPQERAERANDRENELQNQLLDIQENYTALSQRHAKLISEITKAGREDAQPGPDYEGALGDTAVERLKRSNSFAEAVEQVVLEYEKTIQTLESSLSSTRSSLSTSESILLEKETKLAYIETVNQQLQTRLQKMMDRESSTENYLHDLEAKLDGHTSGEEKNSAIVVELRKEIARVRENEASCEDYISTLEERLAEADQDVELMQREIDRLEHVVERQRSLGKLDNLLYELDHIQQDGRKTNGEEVLVNGEPSGDHQVNADDHVVEAPPSSLDGGDPAISEQGERPPSIHSDQGITEQVDETEAAQQGSLESSPSDLDYPPQSPAQSKFVADKLENVTQELFDLRMEHESTLNEFDLLSAKYEEALRTLGELQDVVDESRHTSTIRDSVSPPPSAGPSHFLGDGRVSELKGGETGSSSRSLLSELSLAGESPITAETSEVETPAEVAEPVEALEGSHKETLSILELETIKQSNAEKEEDLKALAQQYEQLQEEHQETLDVVEELKAEVQKAKMSGQAVPAQPIIRRKSSQNVMIIDRAHRSFASLRNIAAENLEDRPDVIQNFELNLNTAMHELHTRSERIQELEADIASVKKEMESKMTIISGLTRERSSIKNSSPMDITVVSSMRDQLLQSENQIRVLQGAHANREEELLSEIQALNAALEAQIEKSQLGIEELNEQHRERDELREKTIFDLQEELAQLRDEHKSAVDSMKASEKVLVDHNSELKAAIGQLEALGVERIAGVEAQEAKPEADFEGERSKHRGIVDSLQKEIGEHKATIESHVAELESERLKHKEMVNHLQREIDEHKAVVDSHAGCIEELEESHAGALGQLAEITASRTVTESDLQAHRDLVSSLQQQIVEHQRAILDQEESVQALQDSHAYQLEEVKEDAWNSARADAESRLADQTAKHEAAINALHAEIQENKDVMETLLQRFKKLEVSFHEQSTVVDNLQDQLKAKSEEVVASEAIGAALQTEVGVVHAEAEKHLDTISELKRLHEESLAEIEKLDKKNQKNSRLVEELEQELSSTFDRHQAATNRLSSLQTERNAILEDARETTRQAQAEAEALREQVSALEARLAEFQPSTPTQDRAQRSNSTSSNLRKSASTASLPSPPPAIPLPPLPNSIPHLPALNVAAANSAPAPPTPTMSRRPSKDLANSQLAEDQEARIRTIEKHLFAEKQLTATLEEALTDLEKQGKKVEEDLKEWKKKCWSLEDEMERVKTQSSASRYSMQAVEEERNARREAEAARAQLEERMNAINKRKKGRSLACF